MSIIDDVCKSEHSLLNVIEICLNTEVNLILNNYCNNKNNNKSVKLLENKKIRSI